MERTVVGGVGTGGGLDTEPDEDAQCHVGGVVVGWRRLRCVDGRLEADHPNVCKIRK
jgi:hypothetical protein